MTWRKVIFAGVLGLGSVSLLQAQKWHGSNSAWVSFTTGSGSVTFQHGPYRFTQKYDPAAFEGQIYIQRKADEKPRLIFEDQRGLELLMGHRGVLALINCVQSTKDGKVYVADTNTGKNWRIDEQALRMFLQNSGADPSLIVVAEGDALSADDRQALLSMDLIYISVSTAEEAEQKGKTFKEWRYAVSTSTGQVLHEFRTSSVPKEWLVEYRESGNPAR